MQDLAAGEEVLVNYGLGMAHAPLWYQCLWVEHCRNDKNMSDDQIEVKAKLKDFEALAATW